MGARVIGMMNSYRKGGAIDTVVAEVLHAAQDQGAEITKIDLVDKHIEYCMNCRACCQAPGLHRGKCVINDDMEEILTTLEEADAIVLGAPVNFGDVNALTSTFLERMVVCILALGSSGSTANTQSGDHEKGGLRDILSRSRTPDQALCPTPQNPQNDGKIAGRQTCRHAGSGTGE